MAVKTKDPSPKDEYCTPQWIIELATETLAWIHTDPWTNSFARSHVLNTPTYGTITSPLQAHEFGSTSWGNPPYSNAAIVEACELWLRALAIQPVFDGLILVNCTPSSGWWRNLAYACTAWVALNKRVSFIDPRTGKPKQGNMWPSCVFYHSKGNQQCLNRFVSLWKQHGSVFGPSVR